MNLFHRNTELSRLRMEKAELLGQITKLADENGRQKAVISMLKNKLHNAQYIRTHDNVLPIDAIRIKAYFTEPSPKKLAACEAFYQEHGVIDRTIAVVHNPRLDTYTLTDGYCGYLVLKAHGAETIRVFQSERAI